VLVLFGVPQAPKEQELTKKLLFWYEAKKEKKFSKQYWLPIVIIAFFALLNQFFTVFFCFTNFFIVHLCFTKSFFYCLVAIVGFLLLFLAVKT